MLWSSGGCISNGIFYPSGVLHSAMPIAVECVGVDKFVAWLNDQA